MTSIAPQKDVCREKRRPSSLFETSLTVPRVYSVFCVTIAIMVATAVIIGSRLAVDRVLAFWIAIFILLVSYQSIVSGLRRWFAINVAICLLVVLAFLHDTELRTAGPIVGMLDFSVRLFAVTGLVGMMASSLGLLRPLKSGVAAFAMSATFVIVAIPFEFHGKPLVAVAPQNATAGFLDDDWTGAIVDELLWAGPKGRYLPEIEGVYVPNAYMKNLYPDDPRSYLQEEQVYGPIDMRLATSEKVEHGQAAIERPSSPEGAVQLRAIEGKVDRNDLLDVEYNQIPFLKDRSYQVTFQARAGGPSSLTVSAVNPLNDRRNLGLQETVNVDQAWNEYHFDFAPSESATSGLIRFAISVDSHELAIKNLRVHPVRREISMNVNAWRLLDDGRANLTPGIGAALAIRVEPRGKKIGNRLSDVRLAQQVFAVNPTSVFEVTFRARSERRQSLSLHLSKSVAPYANLGMHHPIELSEEWQYFGYELSNLAAEAQPLIVFASQSSGAAFELAEVRLWARDGRKRSIPPIRYSVSYALNADGYRDRDHEVETSERTFRIACLGDSYTFGQGVHEADTFVRKVQTILQQRSPHKTFDVMNFGVCGHTTRQERFSYEMFAKKYKPRVVVVTMVFNDNLSYEEEKRLGMHDPMPTDVALLRRFYQMRKNSYNDVGYDGCVRELKLLDESCRREGARLVVVIFSRPIESDLWEEMEQTVTLGLRDTGIPLLNLRHSIPAIPRAGQMVHRLDGHPNEIIHNIAANAIADFLMKEKLLEASN